MSVAFFGFVRKRPDKEGQTTAKDRRPGDLNDMWARRLERLGQLMDVPKGE